MEFLVGNLLLSPTRPKLELVVPRLQTHGTGLKIEERAGVRDAQIDAHMVYHQLYACDLRDKASCSVIGREIDVG